MIIIDTNVLISALIKDSTTNAKENIGAQDEGYGTVVWRKLIVLTSQK